MAKARPEISELKKHIKYDPETGEFLWLVPRRGRNRANNFAGGFDSHGYRRISFGRVYHFAHHIAWAFMTGEWPEMIDHVDGNPQNNTWSNLRLATFSQNGCNRLGRGNWPKGVTFHSQVGKYQAQITKSGKHYYLGLFDTPEEAHAAYRDAAERFHGEFARVA